MKNFIVVVLLIVALPLLGQKKNLTIDDMMKMDRLAAYTVSPNGEWIVYQAGVVDYNANKVIQNLYLLNLKTKTILLLTDGKVSASSPKIGKDNNTLYFTRSGQIQKMNLTTKVVTQVTNFSTGVGGYIISPDEKSFAFDSEVYADCLTDDCNKQKTKAIEKSKASGQIFDHLPFRVWMSWKNGMRSHVWLYSTTDDSYKDLTTGEFDTPPIDLGGDQDYRFSVDGKKLYFTRNPDKNVAWSTNNDVFVHDLTTGNLTNLTSDNHGNDNNANPSPDGKWLAYNSMKRAGFEADQYDLIVMDEKGNKTNLTDAVDLSVGATVWSLSGNSIYFTAETKGYNFLYKISLKDKKLETVISGVYIHHFEVMPDGKQILFSASKTTSPAEIFSFDLKSKQITQLSKINSDILSTIEMNEPEEFWFAGADNRQIHAFAYLPPHYDKNKKYPFVYFIHGGPQGAWGNSWSTRWNPQVWAANGWIVVSPNPTGSTGYGQKLTDDISLDWGGKVYEDLMKGLDATLVRYPQIDQNKMAAAGASYGGYMMNWFQGHTTRFKALVSHDGVYNLPAMFGSTEEVWFPLWEFGGTPWDKPELYKKWSPDQFVNNFKTPTFIIQGALDFRVPETQAFEYFTALQYKGIESKLLYFPDEGHWVLKPQNSSLWHNSIFSWLNKYLK